jgi:2-polyprenyl-3-methyl-5-hydroxy-6-metoxy-1,4-benzoquinol methylase
METVGPIYSDYSQPDPPHQPLYLRKMLDRLNEPGDIRSILDVGCGDGNFTASLAEAGFSLYGVDTSTGGIARAKAKYPRVRFEVASAYGDLLEPFHLKEPFDAIVTIEVIEHLYSPRQLFRQALMALRPHGLLIITTPYWGYLKNLALAVTGRMDSSLTVLWEGGHIKHFSYRTLRLLGEQQHFEFVSFDGAGRIPFLWSGQMMVFRAPNAQEILRARELVDIRRQAFQR